MYEISYSGIARKVGTKQPIHLKGGAFKRSRRKTLKRLRRAKRKELEHYGAEGIAKEKTPMLRLGVFYFGPFAFVSSDEMTRGAFRRLALKQFKGWAKRNRPALVLSWQRLRFGVSVADGGHWEISVSVTDGPAHGKFKGGRADTELSKLFGYTA